MSKSSKQPVGPYSPFFGCSIFVIIGVFFLGIVAWSLHVLRTQDAAIAAFTVEQPVQTKSERLGDADLAALKTKLQTFESGGSSEITFSVDELNELVHLAPDTGNGTFAGMISLTAVNPAQQTLQANVCLPMNRMEFWKGKRYAIGEASFKPEIVKDSGPDFKLTSLIVPGKHVEPKFIEAMAGLYWISHFRQNKMLAPLFKSISDIKITAAGVMVTRGKPTP